MGLLCNLGVSIIVLLILPFTFHLKKIQNKQRNKKKIHVKMMSYDSLVWEVGVCGGLSGKTECSTPQAWKQSIKAMWYEVAFANFFIWKADIWYSPFVQSEKWRQRRKRSSPRRNRQVTALSYENIDMQHDKRILHRPSIGLQGDLFSWEQMRWGNKAFRWRWRTLQNLAEVP